MEDRPEGAGAARRPRRRWLPGLGGALILALTASAAAAQEVRRTAPEVRQTAPGAHQTAPGAHQIPVGEFDRVYFSGAGTVRLTQGSPARLTVRAAARLIEGVDIETRDGVLYIKTTGPAHELLVDLQVARLEEVVSEGDGHIIGDGLTFDVLRLEGNGAGSFQMERLEARTLEVRSRGATRFELSGQVGHQVVDLSGSGAYRAVGLISNSTTVNVTGASAVRFWADELLDVQVAGSAEIRYAGSAQVEQRVSGMASVLRIPQIVI
jgi:hypothetical protein